MHACNPQHSMDKGSHLTDSGSHLLVILASFPGSHARAWE